MRFALALALTLMPCTAIAQVQPVGGNRPFPAQFAAILRNLTKAQAAKMQTGANSFCKRLEYGAPDSLYKNLNQCILFQSMAILGVDTHLFELDDNGFIDKDRPDKIKKCWRLYNALGSSDSENLEQCLGNVYYAELLKREVAAASKPALPLASSYCDRVAQAAGGSYMILEECVKQEDASRRRLGR